MSGMELQCLLPKVDISNKNHEIIGWNVWESSPC